MIFSPDKNKLWRVMYIYCIIILDTFILYKFIQVYRKHFPFKFSLFQFLNYHEQSPYSRLNMNPKKSQKNARNSPFIAKIFRQKNQSILINLIPHDEFLNSSRADTLQTTDWHTTLSNDPRTPHNNILLSVPWMHPTLNLSTCNAALFNCLSIKWNWNQDNPYVSACVCTPLPLPNTYRA